MKCHLKKCVPSCKSSRKGGGIWKDAWEGVYMCVFVCVYKHSFSYSYKPPAISAETQETRTLYIYTHIVRICVCVSI